MDALLATLADTYDVIPILALELEWYVLDISGQSIGDGVRDAYLEALQQATHDFPIHSINKEDGIGQVEAALLPTQDHHALAKQSQKLKLIACDVARKLDTEACFFAKPFAQDYGNGLHIHVHLENTAGEWLMTKQSEQLSNALSWSLGGLLATMKENLLTFAGSEAAYARYERRYDAPTTVSWGMNNRTTALRLPDASAPVQGADALLLQPPNYQRRIEHRVASAEADIAQVIEAILSGILHGFEHRIEASELIYGDASDAQYGLERLVEL